MGLCDPRSGTIFYPQRNPNIYEYQIPFIVSDYWFYTVNIVALFQVIPTILQGILLLYSFIQYHILNAILFVYNNRSDIEMTHCNAPAWNLTNNILDVMRT